MCKLLEDMRNETAIQEKVKIAQKLLVRNRDSLEEIAELTDLPLEKIQKMAKRENV